MAARRTIYIALLLAAAAFHFVYGQYLTHYLMIFLICVPLLSLIISIPSALGARAELSGGGDVVRGEEGRMLLKLTSSERFPSEAWSVTVCSRNLFTGRVGARQRVKVKGSACAEKEFSPDTSQLGSLCFSIKRAFVYDKLGLIPIPIRRGGSACIIVLPDKEKPEPEPDLDADSTLALKPKRSGFSEEHELRPFIEGDSLNLIHWKLSRKYDGLIVREPQEAVRRELVLAIDATADYESHRSMLEQLSYLNEELCNKDIPYTIQYGHRACPVRSSLDYDDFIAETLSSQMKGETAIITGLGRDALVYRITPGRRLNA